LGRYIARRPSVEHSSPIVRKSTDPTEAVSKFQQMQLAQQDAPSPEPAPNSLSRHKFSGTRASASLAHVKGILGDSNDSFVHETDE
jgi:hypothetical protein